MKLRNLFNSCLAASVLVAGSVADGASPNKPQLTTYTTLWTKSPFTVPPPPPAPIEEPPSKLEDYTLAGVAGVEGDWYVVLMNKKKRTERIRLNIGEKHRDGFEVVNVKKGAGRKDTTVQIKVGGRVGTVGYDDQYTKLVNVPKTTSKKAPKGKPTKRPAPRAPVANKKPVPKKGSRPPKVRRIPVPRK